jgi:hypothetical protein
MWFLRAASAIETPVVRRREAGGRARTGDIQLGRLALYQLSYTRVGIA